MIAEGAPLLDMANDISWYTRAGWGIRMLLKGNVDENAHRNHGGDRSLDRGQPAATEFGDDVFAGGRSQTGKVREFVFTDGSQAGNT